MTSFKKQLFDFKTQYGLGFNAQDDEIDVDFFCGGGAGNGTVEILQTGLQAIAAGSIYRMRAYYFHQTEPGGDEKVATILKKGWEGQQGAQSSGVIGIKPDEDFDRYQWSLAQLWEVVADVLLCQGVA